jgi:hypothetical protein
LGYPTIHPVFADFATRAKVMSIAEPGHTDALEFDDGKLMLGKHQSLRDVNWQNILERVGLAELKRSINQAELVGMVNWTMLPHLSDIWKNLSSEVFPSVPKTDRLFFVDLCDPEKRTADDLRAAMRMLTQIEEQMKVILGLNLKEATQVGDVLGLARPDHPEEAIEETAQLIRQTLQLNCVMVHPRKGAAAATSDGRSAKFFGPFVKEPKISTGAGDHFNAGFCLGRVLGLDLEESLCTGVGMSGYYVRTADSPSITQLAEFISSMPAPEL